MLLTGTPISNKVDDLCSLIDILGVDARLAKIALLNAMRSEQKAALDKIKKHRHFVLDDDGEMEMGTTRLTKWKLVNTGGFKIEK